MTNEHARIITETRTPISNSPPVATDIKPNTTSLTPKPPGVILITINNDVAVATNIAPNNAISAPKE